MRPKYLESCHCLMLFSACTSAASLLLVYTSSSASRFHLLHMLTPPLLFAALPSSFATQLYICKYTPYQYVCTVLVCISQQPVPFTLLYISSWSVHLYGFLIVNMYSLERHASCIVAQFLVMYIGNILPFVASLLLFHCLYQIPSYCTISHSTHNLCSWKLYRVRFGRCLLASS